ncbi:hypothetical protein EVAR_25821_1 [Eumeta japonica]|uniref:Glucuronosyltransferase n=1 Tax=Eumeta variegata TaxID=151549 RepID=A0A4C1VWJ1_EUMVA|nr:hypothetical protein EVAR_25821_1 [Eumeta japonica]
MATSITCCEPDTSSVLMKLFDCYTLVRKFSATEVTYITPFPRKELPPKFRQIIVDYPDDSLPGNIFTIEKILDKTVDITDVSSILSTFLNSTVNCIRHENVRNLINDPNESFDVVIIESMLLNAIAGFAAVFQAPLIWSNPAEVSWMPLSLVDEAPNPAYAPDILADYFPPLYFLATSEAVVESDQYARCFTVKWGVMQEIGEITCSTLLGAFLWNIGYVNSNTENLYEEVFVAAGKKKGIVVPPLNEVKYNASFMFSNSHVSLGGPYGCRRTSYRSRDTT